MSRTVKTKENNISGENKNEMIFGAASGQGIFGAIKDSTDVYFAHDTIYLPNSDGFFPNSTDGTYSFSTVNLRSASISGTTPSSTTILTLDVDTDNQKITLAPVNAGSCTILLTFIDGSTKTLTVYVKDTRPYFNNTAGFYSGPYDASLSNIVTIKPTLSNGATVNNEHAQSSYIQFSFINAKTKEQEGSQSSYFYRDLNNKDWGVGSYIGYYAGSILISNSLYIFTPTLSKMFKITPSIIKYTLESKITTSSTTYNASKKATATSFNTQNSTATASAGDVAGLTTQYGWTTTTSANSTTKPTSWTNYDSNFVYTPSANAGTYNLWMRSVLKNSNYKMDNSQSDYLNGKYIGSCKINKCTVSFDTLPSIINNNTSYTGSNIIVVNAYTLKNNSTSTSPTIYSTTGANTQFGFTQSNSTTKPSSWKTVSTPSSDLTVKNAGTYYIWIKSVLTDSTNYDFSTSQNDYLNGKYIGSVVINKAAYPQKNINITQTSPTSGNITSTGSASFTLNQKGPGTVTGWTLTPNTATLTVTDSSQKLTVNISNFKINKNTNYTLTVNVAANDSANYNGTSVTKTFTCYYVEPTTEPFTTTTTTTAEPTTPPMHTTLPPPTTTTIPPMSTTPPVSTSEPSSESASEPSTSWS